MKRTVFAGLMLLTALYVYGQDKIVTLDEAILGAVQQIQNYLPEGQKIVVLQFKSHDTRLSNEILKKLSNGLEQSHYNVVDQTTKEFIDAENEFQSDKIGNMIKDESLPSFAKRVDAQILTGSLDDAINHYSFWVKVIVTQTNVTTIPSYLANVDRNDKQIAAYGGYKTTSQKFKTGTFNIALGLGSYFEGDITGGLTITGGYALAIGLIVIDAVALDWDSPAVGVPATIGVAAAGLTLAYGFVRPFIYNRAPSVAVVLDNVKAGIILLSDTTGNRSTGFQATYKIKF
jgi:hypothetical protein